MEGKVKVIVKRPDEEYGHVTNISMSLKNLQKTVEGYIETVSVGENAVCICNEEGKILKLQPNFWMGMDALCKDLIRGTVVIVGVDGEDFVDIPFDFDTWKRILKKSFGFIILN